MTKIELEAFVDAYCSNVASLPRDSVTDFVIRYESGEDIDYIGEHTGVMDALGMWNSGIRFAEQRMKQKSLIDQVLDQIGTDYEKGDLTAVEELLLKVDENILRGYLPEQA